MHITHCKLWPQTDLKARVQENVQRLKNVRLRFSFRSHKKSKYKGPIHGACCIQKMLRKKALGYIILKLQVHSKNMWWFSRLAATDNLLWSIIWGDPYLITFCRDAFRPPIKLFYGIPQTIPGYLFLGEIISKKRLLKIICSWCLGCGQWKRFIQINDVLSSIKLSRLEDSFSDDHYIPPLIKDAQCQLHINWM